MDIGVIRERGAFDRRVALTPPVVRQLAGAGHTVWVETGAGDGAMFRDTEYIRAGALIAYSPEEVLQRAGLVAKIGRPTAQELALCRPGMALVVGEDIALRGVDDDAGAGGHLRLGLGHFGDIEKFAEERIAQDRIVFYCPLPVLSVSNHH